MAQKYLNVAQTAEKLGVSEDEVRQMREQRQLNGYRDGADWKFKTEDIDRIAQERGAGGDADAGDEAPQDEGDVLMSEVEIGESDSGASGTVIGMKPDAPSGESDLDTSTGQPAGGEGSTGAQFEDLDLSGDSDLTIEDSTPAGEDESVPLDDDELVLGGSGSGSGSGSDISLGGDSGISLVDPSDSGISLEEPLDLGAGEESLELGEDDMVALDEGEGSSGGSQAEDDFLLTPLDDDSDEDSESSSQVIALDQEGDSEETIGAAGGGGGMAAMLDEDLTEGADGLDSVDTEGMPLGTAPGTFGEGAPMAAGAGAVALPEEPWPVWTVVLLGLCGLLLAFCGVFMADLMRNMWSWQGTYDINSSMMDWLLSLFEG
jgi:excisionase family DNA binding protein